MSQCCAARSTRPAACNEHRPALHAGRPEQCQPASLAYSGSRGRRGPESGPGTTPARHQCVCHGQLLGQRTSVGPQLQQRLPNPDASLRQQLCTRSAANRLCRRCRQQQHRAGQASKTNGYAREGTQPTGRPLSHAGTLSQPLQAIQPADRIAQSSETDPSGTGAHARPPRTGHRAEKRHYALRTATETTAATADANMPAAS